MLCFSAIINAYLYGLISYLDYKHYTKTYIAYHEITDEQFIEAYAKADAFFVSRKPLVVQGVQKSLSDEKSNKKKKTPL